MHWDRRRSEGCCNHIKQQYQELEHLNLPVVYYSTFDRQAVICPFASRPTLKLIDNGRGPVHTATHISGVEARRVFLVAFRLSQISSTQRKAFPGRHVPTALSRVTIAGLHSPTLRSTTDTISHPSDIRCLLFKIFITWGPGSKMLSSHHKLQKTIS